jgi:hypothetical protein
MNNNYTQCNDINIATLNMMRISITALRITTLNVMTLNMTALRLMTISIRTVSKLHSSK